ncbi:hypothetical protein DFH94DRAFT_700137 [Russula ochroleuca]|uniref:Uncharacterized protein n=1 Tax=Russula ochroleuca TaxID=152965 RepID=A0A9P5JT00_9AGAM|nr:hypothetical protein DFH94DRAFT_700137 [Russula ochroleuca]
MPAVHSPGLKQRGKKSNSEEQKMDIIKSSIPLPVQLPMAVATVLPGPPPPKKRGRPPKAAASDEESNPMAKRSKSNGAKGGRKPATSAQAKIPAPTRDALPACTVRNDCPATKANLLPAPRCSTKQVAVDHEALRQAAEEEVERGIAATKFLAQMQVDEEELDAAMEANIPQQISAVTGMRPVEGIEDDEAESFESVSSCSEDYHNNEVKVVPAKPVAKRPTKKGAIHTEIDAAAERLHSQQTPKRNVPVDHRLQFDKAALCPKKYANAGLHPDARIARNSTEDGHGADSEAVIGGLTDDHTHATRPGSYSVQHGPTSQLTWSQLTFLERLQHDPSCKNEMVAIIGEYTGINVNNAVPVNKKSKGTCNKKNDSDDIVPHANPCAETFHTMQWMGDPLWAAAFIPSLLQALYVSVNPFADFKRESGTFLMVIQQVFDISIPHIQYTFRLDNKLVGEVNATFYSYIHSHSTC